MPAPFFAGAPGWKPAGAPGDDLVFEATGAPLGVTPRELDPIPADFDPDEVLDGGDLEDSGGATVIMRVPPAAAQQHAQAELADAQARAEAEALARLEAEQAAKAAKAKAAVDANLAAQAKALADAKAADALVADAKAADAKAAAEANAAAQAAALARAAAAQVAQRAEDARMLAQMEDPPTETNIVDASVLVESVTQAALQTPASSAQRPKQFNAVIAPLSRRLASLVIDLLPVAGALMLVLLALEGRLEKGGAPLLPTSMHGLGKMFWSLGAMIWVVVAVLVLVPLIYHTLALHFMGGSVGDLLFGIRWVTKTGARPSIVRSLVRGLVAIPSWALAFSGVALALLTRSRRTLYDIVTGCYPVLK